MVAVAFPRDVVSFPAVASHVLLHIAPWSTCNVGQAAQVLLANTWAKPEQSSPAPTWGRETPSPLPSSALSSDFLSTDCSASYTYKLNPCHTPAPHSQPLNQGQQEKMTVKNVNHLKLGVFRSGADPPQSGSPFVSSHKPPGHGQCGTRYLPQAPQLASPQSHRKRWH